MNRLFLYLRTIEFRKNFLLAVLSAVILIVIIFFALRSYTRHGESLHVPDLKGLTMEKAVALLRDKGAGNVLPKGVSINLTLGDGKGEAEVDIPNLIGLTLSEARLAASGGSSSLSIGEVIYEGPIGDTSKAVIIRQNPFVSDTLMKIAIGSRINIVLSK